MTISRPAIDVQVFAETLFAAHPYLYAPASKGIVGVALVEEVFWASATGRAMLRGVATSTLEDEMVQTFFALSGFTLSVFTDEELNEALALGSEAFQRDYLPFLAWVEEVAFRDFSKDYVVENLSYLTVGRWIAFGDEWIKLATEPARRVLTDYFTGIKEEGLEPEWALALATGNMPDRFEVPYVEPVRPVEQEALPRDAEGKVVEL